MFTTEEGGHAMKTRVLFSLIGLLASTITAIPRPTASVGVTVVMFQANEPGAQGAFNAVDVLRQYQ
jgi:hypothetical protein